MRSIQCLTVVAISATLAATGCGTTDPEKSAITSSSAEAALGADALVEEHDDGTVAFHVARNGEVKVKASAKASPAPEPSGTLTWNPGGTVKTVPLTYDKAAGLLVASGPALEGELTEIGYTIVVEGKPLTGTLHLPVGGTAELVASSRAPAAVQIPEGKTGPHGGTIVVVGEDRLEIAVAEGGEMRVYLLDADLAPVSLGARTIKIGLVADSPQIVALVTEPGGAHATGLWQGTSDPVRVTVVVSDGATTRVVLVGYRPGARFVVGRAAPRVKVQIKGGWGPSDDARVKTNGNGGVKLDVKTGNGRGAGGKVGGKSK
jgi:hypothetical protein